MNQRAIVSESMFDVKDLVFKYNEILALNGLSLSIEKGKRIAILGSNGSGKSTLLRLLDALYFPHSGAIAFDGEPLTEDRLRVDEIAFGFRKRVGLLFQNPDVQLFNPTVFDELAFGPLQLNWPKDKILHHVSEVLRTMDIAQLKDRSPHRLSGGEKKRVALASVLILDPEVLLLDEPTAALDPKSQSQLVDFLVGWAGGAKTIITATHDLGIVEDIADNCFVFQNGVKVGEGIPSAILRDEALLKHTNLIHSHRHVHASGEVHSHPHIHRGHEH